MKRDITVVGEPTEWELVDPIKPMRMFSAEELRAAMGFPSPVTLIHESPPCANSCRPISITLENEQ
jgi:hypothetical protein